MTDGPTPFGLGWLESPTDNRDWGVDALYAATGTELPVELPASYHVPAPLYPVVDQGSTPQCVAYSAAGEQGWYDLRDTGLALFDEALFFRQIGGTSNGAVIRDAPNARLTAGYPVAGHPELAGQHRIAAYYAVPVAQADLCAAILSFGPLVIGTPWARSWFHPVDGVLPAFDSAVGGHAILAVGWDATGLRLRNSWGADWGQAGEVTLPWAQLAHVREAWKAVDRVEPRPSRTSWALHVAHGATVVHYALDKAGRLTDTRRYLWTGRASSAPCRQPVVKIGAVRGQATLALVTAGVFKIRWVHIGSGVTATSTTSASPEESRWAASGRSPSCARSGGRQSRSTCGSATTGSHGGSTSAPSRSSWTGR